MPTDQYLASLARTRVVLDSLPHSDHAPPVPPPPLDSKPRVVSLCLGDSPPKLSDGVDFEANVGVGSILDYRCGWEVLDLYYY